jgi:hypothetical protein
MCSDLNRDVYRRIYLASPYESHCLVTPRSGLRAVNDETLPTKAETQGSPGYNKTLESGALGSVDPSATAYVPSLSNTVSFALLDSLDHGS